MLSPLVILAIGIVTVIGLIIVLKMNAFVALIIAAIAVSLLTSSEELQKFSREQVAAGKWTESAANDFVRSPAPLRVATAFGESAGKIGIVIALAAIIGKCLMDSGAADRIVRSLLAALGERRAPAALLSSGFILSIPVFFDTVFYLLVPLARSLWKRTHKNYMLYILSIGAGAAITHTLVPPTPGPLLMAGNLGVDLGVMIMVGTLIAAATAVTIVPFCNLVNRLMDLPMRPYGGEAELEPLADVDLPPLGLSLLPIVLPVILIAANTVTKTMAAASDSAWLAQATRFTALLGDANLALLLSAGIAMAILVRSRSLSFTELAKTAETALMSGGVIILITAGGGAFGAMLGQTGVKDSITLGSDGQSGLVLLAAGFGIACVMKVAQGSSTVAMIVTSGMIASMGTTSEITQILGCHPVYLCTAIGSGSLVGSWMNDSGFWIFSRMSGLTEVETLKAWSTLLVLLGLIGLGYTLLFAWLMPLTGA
jgi:GntP family gluconate:H+ symporter